VLVLLLLGCWALLAGLSLLVVVGACRSGLREEIGRGFPT
jgi:hypothetical protein